MSLRRNTFYGALGFAVPTAVLLAAYPVVLRHLGARAMGVYLLANTISGSLAFLEFGVSTATVKVIAERMASGDRRGAADVVATSLVFYGALSVIGLAVFWLLAPQLARWSDAGPDLEPQATAVLRIAAVQFLPAYLNGVLGSVFKGLQRFEFSTFTISLLSALVWGGGAVAVGWFGFGVIDVAGLALVATLATCLVSGWLALALSRDLGIDLLAGRPRWVTLRSMLRFGVFMAVNGLAGVLMLQVQTWLIAALVGVAAVTVFSTAIQITSKINALMNTMFEPVLPIAAAMGQEREPTRLRALRSAYNKALGLSLGLSLTAAAVLYVSAPLLITLWLHSSIDAEVIQVIRILCVGLAINGATPVAYHLMNGIGRPEINTGFMVMGIVLFYAVLLVFWLRGLDLRGFAVATSSALFLNGIAYLAFSEAVVWRRWMAAGRPMVARS